MLKRLSQTAEYQRKENHQAEYHENDLGCAHLLSSRFSLTHLEFFSMLLFLLFLRHLFLILIGSQHNFTMPREFFQAHLGLSSQINVPAYGFLDRILQLVEGYWLEHIRIRAQFIGFVHLCVGKIC